MKQKNENIIFRKERKLFFAHEKFLAQDTGREKLYPKKRRLTQRTQNLFFFFSEHFWKKKLKRRNKTANDT